MSCIQTIGYRFIVSSIKKKKKKKTFFEIIQENRMENTLEFCIKLPKNKIKRRHFILPKDKLRKKSWYYVILLIGRH